MPSQSGALHTSTSAEAMSSMCFAFLSKRTVHLGWGCHLDKWRCLCTMCFHRSWGMFTNCWLRLLRVGILHDLHCESCKLEKTLPPVNAGEEFLHFFRCFMYGYISSTASNPAGIKPRIFMIVLPFSLIPPIVPLCSVLFSLNNFFPSGRDISHSLDNISLCNIFLISSCLTTTSTSIPLAEKRKCI